MQLNASINTPIRFKLLITIIVLLNFEPCLDKTATTFDVTLAFCLPNSKHSVD